MSTRTVTLAPDEILVQGRKRKLVPGYTEWSYCEYYYSSRKTDVTVFYKQDLVVFLRKRVKGYAASGIVPAVLYPDLAAVVEAHKNCWSVKDTDDYNKKHGIVQWCQVGETVATMTVAITAEEMDSFERVAHAKGLDIETLATHVIRAFLTDQISY